MIDKDIIFPKIIIGSRGCGKTQYMHDLIDDQIKREPNKKIVIIRTNGINPYYGFFQNKRGVLTGGSWEPEVKQLTEDETYAVGDVVCDYGVFENGELKLITNSRGTAEKIVELLKEDERIHRELNPVNFDGQPVHCKNCKHLMFSDFYGECSKGYKGIVRPWDSCEHGEFEG